MTKIGTKLKCMIKRWNSSNRITRSGRESGGASSRSSQDGDAWQSASFRSEDVPSGFHTVYVGKSRRRFLISSKLVDHPLFRVLVERSGGSDGGATTVVGCEVVLFEHLLWMLENADPQPESLDEFVEFYAC